MKHFFKFGETPCGMVLPQEDNYTSLRLDEARISINSINHIKPSQSIHEKYPNNENDRMLYPTLDYINRILLEADIDKPFNEYEDVAAISDMEKPFYDILGEKYPPSPNTELILSQPKSNCNSNTYIFNNEIIPRSSGIGLTEESRSESLLAKVFQRGVEEGKKFLPTINNLAIDTSHKKKSSKIELDGRCSKMSMFYTEDIIRNEMFDKVLLNHEEEYMREEISHLPEIRKCQANQHCNQKEYLEDNINLKSLLVQCSEAVAHSDPKKAKELIKELRKHASPVGTGTQRLTCILTDGLEARLIGTGSETYYRLINRRISTREILKAYQMYIRASPLLRIWYCFATDYICKVAENASRIHIIDLGIYFGFQWPPLIQALAKRRGGAPKLRITGIDLPQPGFCPAERLKQVGVRLEDYAKSFGVPFEYQCIASLWESICIDDLKIDDEEVLIVNSMCFQHVRDEALSIDTPRNRVLNLIRHMKPKVFIIGISDLSFSPFFTSRFKKVLSLYSMLFDMFDTLVPRDDEGRQLMERAVLAPPIFNLVACEGQDQVERPETYKQWHKRISQAGFKLLAMDQDIFKDCNAKVKSGYHEEFFVQEESDWLLQGWKGRIIYGLSVWEPK
ncbi:hypothetical protein LUZ61_017392 [Rhynchospora tenuis]|uniref:Uncharacterized protein n=1 Tax=Rhynchospora tenuis TaxID=198213 RepID=A0AAD5Z7D2_9POAL|nr:hypothetical protein LUZ61_017392 [Rhynchospora tenuis]